MRKQMLHSTDTFWSRELVFGTLTSIGGSIHAEETRSAGLRPWNVEKMGFRPMSTWFFGLGCHGRWSDGDRANTFWGTPSPFWAKNRSQRVKERLEMFIFPRIDYSRSEPCPIWTLNSKNWLQEVKFSPMNGIWSRPRTHDFWLSVTQCHHRRNRLPRNGSPCT